MRGMRKVYASDISREQFEPVRVLLENARKKTRPRTVDLYEVFCAILYLLKSGCQFVGYASRTFSNFSVELNPKRYAVRTLPGYKVDNQPIH